MDRPIDRWTAAVDANVARFERDELALLTGQGVPELDAHQMGSMSATARAEIPRPAPSLPARFPVYALTFIRSDGRPSSAPIASRISSRRGARWGRAAIIVKSTDAARRPTASSRRS